MNSLPRLLKRDGRVDDESWKKAINYCFEGNEGGMDERNKSRSSGGKFNSPPRFMPRSWQQPLPLSLSLSLVGTLRVTYSPSLLRPKEAFACLPAERRQRNRVGQTLWNTARFIAREVAANRIQILDSAHLSLSLSLSLSLFFCYIFCSPSYELLIIPSIRKYGIRLNEKS